VASTLKEFDGLPIDKLGPRVRVDYSPRGEYGREWLRDLLGDLDEDGSVEIKNAMAKQSHDYSANLPNHTADYRDSDSLLQSIHMLVILRTVRRD
jgi:hypothetical protein